MIGFLFFSFTVKNSCLISLTLCPEMWFSCLEDLEFY